MGRCLLAMLFLSGFLVTSGEVASAAETPSSGGAATWGVGPVVAAGEPSRAALVHPLIPGRSVSDTVLVTNFSLSPLTFQVYAQDAVNTDDGGFDLLSGSEASRDIGLWVRISQRSVTVPARSRAEVPFRIEVPADASPGDHSGGIVAALLEPAKDGSGRDVTVERRVGTRIYGRVPGDVRATLTASEPVTRYTESFNPFRAGIATATYTVRNTGNVRLGAHPSVTVKDLTGRVVRTMTAPVVREVLPGQSVTVVLAVPGIWPLGRFTVETGVQAVPVQGTEASAPAPRGDTSTSYLWAWPWTALVLFLLFILLA